MKRKVIQIAGSTQLVSLPRKWAIKYGIKKGDEIDVTEEGDNINICAGPSKKFERVILNVDNYKLFVMRAVGSLYKSGYDEIELKFNDYNLVKDIPHQINELLPGFEVLDQSENKFLIKSVATEDSTEFDSALRRIFIVTVAMARNIVEILESSEKSNVNSILQLEMTNNRFCNFCERLLNKKGYNNHDKITFIYNIVWEMEKIGDQFKYMCIHLNKGNNNSKASKGVIDLARNATKMIEMFHELFYKFDQNLVAEIADMRKESISRCNNILAQRICPEAKIVHHLSNVIQMVFDIVSSYLSIVVKPEEKKPY